MPNHRCGKLNVSRTGLTRFELVMREPKSRALPLGDSPKNMAHIPSIILRRSQMPHLTIRYFSLSATRKSDMHRIDGAAFQHCPSFELQGIAQFIFRSSSSASISNSRNCFAFFKS